MTRGRDLDIAADPIDVHAMDEHKDWLTPEDIAGRCGMTADWVRRQIAAGRLAATVWVAGGHGRRTYRVAAKDWVAFRDTYSGPANDPRFSDEG